MAKTHEHEGRTYDESKRYRDANGETWSFTGRGRQMSPSFDSSRGAEAPLAWVADFAGPLTEVR